MELTFKKDINPHDFSVKTATLTGTRYFTRNGEIVFAIPDDETASDLIALIAMAGAGWNFINRQGQFADPDDLNGVL